MANNIITGVNALKNHLKSEIKLLFDQPNDTLQYELVIDVLGTETLEINSDVTEYYVENNTWYNDNISVKPQVYRLQGEIGELYWYNKDRKQNYVGYVNQKLMPIAEFAPVRSAIGQQFMDDVTKIQSYLEVGANLWDRISNMQTGFNRQQIAYAELNKIFTARAPITVRTPWANKKVVITSAILTQPEHTTDKTQLNMTYKEFRETQMSSVKFNASDYRGRVEESNQPEDKLGQQTGFDSTLKYIAGG